MPNNFQPLGTIITSPLNFSELASVLGELVAFNATTSTYAPCDDRRITGSLLAQRIPWLTHAPDCRGMFLRGLNFMLTDGQEGPLSPEFSDLDDDGQPIRRAVLNPQYDSVKKHNHPAHGTINGSVSGSNNTKDVDGGDEKYNSDPNFGSHDVSVVVGDYPSIGGVETRPKNRAVYYYIKIN